MATRTAGQEDGTDLSLARSSLRTTRPPDAPIEEDAFYDLLTNARRRACIAWLSRRDGQVTVESLVDHVAAVEAAGDPDTQLEKSIYVSLRQTHLPRLDEYDVVRFDSDANVVEPGPALDSFVDGSSVSLPRQPWAFIGLGVLALGWLAGGVLDVFAIVDRRVMLVALGFLFLVVLLGLWEVMRVRSAVE